MIQELVDFGKRVTTGKDKALKETPFAIDLVINEAGEFVRFIVGEKRSVEAEVITAKKGKARFLLDKGEEVLGIGDAKKHQLFLHKLEQYRKDLLVIEPVFKFYDDRNENGVKKAATEYANLDKKAKTENITFMIGTTRLLQTDEVRAAIVKHYKDNEHSLSNGRVCSICGKSDSPVLDEPHGLVKMPKGQTAGSALVSFNENAFESYGLKGNLNSSICRDCARNYIEGLSFLLSDGHEVPGEGKRKAHYQYHHRINISDTTVTLFWTRKEAENINPFMIYDTPDASQIRNLFTSVWSGKKDTCSAVETNMFYNCTLSSAAARIAVRDWTAISLDEYRQNLADWFQDIEIVDFNGGITYLPLRLLVNATQRDKKPGDKMKSDLNSKSMIGTILWNSAIKGHSYKIPLEVLQSVLNRLWKDDIFSAARAAVIKLVINRNTDKNMKSTLEESNTSVAYLCGRLFAIIESMQWKAIGNVNNSVKNRYFTAAASQPAFIFGTLLTKNVPIYQHKIGGYLAKEMNDLAGTISKQGKLPRRFSTIEQGEFALGYYFQRTQKTNNETSEKH